MERDLTTGSIGRNILKFSLPYFLSYFLQTLYGMADLFIIGQFNGVASTTAVSIGSQVMHMITVMIVGIAMGTTVMIGKSVGAKQKKETSKIIGNTVSLFVCLSVVLTVVLLFFVHGNCDHTYDRITGGSQTDRQCDVDTGRGSRRNDPLSDNLLYRDSFYYSL